MKEIGILDAGNETYEKINKNQEYDFSILYTTLLHDKLIESLYNLLILSLKVEIEHTFVFSKIMLYTGEKNPKTT